MGAGAMVLLIVIYCVARETMPFSALSQAPEIDVYLKGALLGPLLDLVAFLTVAMFGYQRLERFKVLRPILVGGALVAGLMGFGLEAAPIVLDLQAPQRVEQVVVAKPGEGTLVVRPLTGEPATRSLYLPNDEQYRRVPLGIPVEFRVAPRCEVAFVQGVLE